MSVWLIVALGILVLLGLYVVYAYNSLVRVRNEAETGWANIDVQLRRRADLIPNLVEAVKGYAAHERTVFDEVTRARAAVLGAEGPQAAAEANAALGAALGRLFAVAEAYPQLRASENFVKLQDELTDTEDKIAAARRYYNATVLRFNTRQQTFPTLIVARLFRFRPREFFEAGEEAEGPVEVAFGTAG
ncbi:MAG TPA: LemA family protein [Gaiellaceae bacterium]|nr:LemA family protein [Gaiellaceae bacterium]